MSHCGVVIPIYADNAQRVAYLRTALQSLSRQQAPFVGVVVDDGSPLSQQISQTVASCNDARLRYFKRAKPEFEAKSSSGPINYGIELLQSKEALCTTEKFSSFCYLHSDDMFSQDSLTQRLDKLDQNGIVHSGILLVNAQNKPRKVSRGETQSPFAMRHWTLLWSAYALDKTLEYTSQFGHGLFDPSLAACEDLDATISTTCAVQDQVYSDSISYYYREEGVDRISAYVSKADQRAIRELVEQKHGFEKSPRKKVLSNLWSMTKVQSRGIRHILERPFRKKELSGIDDKLLNLD